MTEKQICRVGDTVTGTCYAHNGSRQFTGTWTQGSGLCTADGIAMIRVGDKGTTDCGHHITATGGGSIGDTEGRYFHRVGDLVTVDEGGTGVSVTGSNTAWCI
jgi:hypothetical protein